MQKILISILALITVFAVFSCKKGTVVSDHKSLGIGSYVTLVKTNNTILDFAALATTRVSIVVKEFGSPIDKIRVHVTKGSPNLNKAVWKFVKEFTYIGETTLELSAIEIAAGLGIPPAGLETGATYTLYNQIVTKDGRVFDIVNTDGRFAGNVNYNMVLTWSAVVVCPYVATGFAGNFRVEEDGWDDFAVGDVLSVAAGPGANQISITAYPNPAFGGGRVPIVVSITPATGVATVATQTYGNYGAAFVMNTATVGADNWVFSCVGTIKLRLSHITTGGANFGSFWLRLKKI